MVHFSVTLRRTKDHGVDDMGERAMSPWLDPNEEEGEDGLTADTPWLKGVFLPFFFSIPSLLGPVTSFLLAFIVMKSRPLVPSLVMFKGVPNSMRFTDRRSQAVSSLCK